MRGKNTLDVEILNISPHGIWIYVKGKEYALPFDEYPWFKDAKISEIGNVEFKHGHHLRWPALDIDLDLNSLENTASYPLIYK